MVVIFNSNEELVKSWKRSKEFNVSQNKIGDTVLEEYELKQYKEKNMPLLKSIYPTIEHLSSWFSSLNSMIFITDSNGFVLRKIANPKFLDETKMIFLQEGANCSEQVRGTNSAGTVSVAKKTLSIVGEEHYLDSHKKYYCIGSPIFNSYGELLAVLNITGHAGHFQPAMTGMVDAITRKIENYNLVGQNNSQHLILSLYSEHANSQALLAVNNDGLITSANREAHDLFNLKTLAQKNIHIDSILSGTEQLLNGKDSETSSDSFIIHHKGKVEIPFHASVLLDSRPKLYSIKSKGHRPTSDNHSKKVRHNHMTTYTFNDIYNEDKAFQSAIRMAKKAAKTDYVIMITGKSGTGKDMVSHAIHHASSRSDKPFIAMNCGGVSKSLMESELFGYESGAFTGAKQSGSPGKFEQADGGTLFLDEIAEMPMEMQITLLRVLQDFTITRVGGTKPIQVDVRIIAATHTDLWEKVQKGEFRADLFYRLQGIHITLPPLRERTDRLSLAEFMLKKVKKEFGEQHLTFSPAAKKLIETYAWPGNVRQLIGALREATFSSENGQIDTNCFPNYILLDKQEKKTTNSSLKEAERKAIDEAMVETGGNITKAANLLGIGRTTLYRKLEEYSIN